MLTIRDEQLKALGQRSTHAFAAQLTAHLSAQHPAASAALGGNSALRAFVQRVLARAAQLGVDSPAGITALAELLLQFGESFERSPLREWSSNILDHPLMAGELKVETVWERHYNLTEGRPVVQA